MSQENLALVRAIHDAFDRGDYETALSWMDEHVEYVSPQDMGGEVFRGPEGLRRGFIAWIAAWEDHRFEVRELIDAGDGVLVVGWQTGRGKESGVEVSSDLFTYWTIRSGRIVGLRMFRDRAEALDAAGLRE